MLRTEAYASQMGTLSDARRLFGNFGRGSTSLRGRRLKAKGKGVFDARETRGPGRARREGRKETGVSEVWGNKTKEMYYSLLSFKMISFDLFPQTSQPSLRMNFNTSEMVYCVHTTNSVTVYIA